ncbi:MAG: type II toxin-antitoxin system PemK/MazF family toxin [Thiotrichales bacterium]|nr:type II toxin-antitoxin system PemK/MazF family toxin [Thiotrichales bacterium]
MKRGEIWWVTFDPAVGSEIQKMRPAVIVSNDISNQYLSRVVVVPFTSNTKRIYPSDALVTVDGKPAKALTDQIMAADKSRLKTKFGTLSVKELTMVEAAIKVHLDMT